MMIQSTIAKHVDLLATRTYIYNLLEKKEGYTLCKLYRDFSGKSYKICSSYHDEDSGAIYKYAYGKCCMKNKKFIRRASKELPGTELILNHPLWLILKNPRASIEEIHNLMKLLDPKLQLRLFSKDKKTGIYNRIRSQNTIHILRISLDNNLDAFACLLMMMREAELMQRWHLYTKIKWATFYLFLRLTYVRPLSAIMEEIHILIYDYFFQPNDPITSKHTNNILKKELVDCYRAPATEYLSVHFIQDTFSGIEWNAAQDNLLLPTKENILNFLFWASHIDLHGVDKALKAYTPNNSSQLINQLMAAYNSKNKGHHFCVQKLLD